MGERLDRIRAHRAEDDRLLERARSLYPRGTRVMATVAEVHPCGLVLDLPGVGRVGFMDWLSVDPAGTPTRFDAPEAPVVGDALRAVVVDDHPDCAELRLSCRLQHFDDRHDGQGIITALPSVTAGVPVAAALREVLNRIVGLRTADVENVSVLIDAGEWKVALETLCTQLFEYDVEIDGSVRGELIRLGHELDTPSGHLLGDPREEPSGGRGT